MKSGNHAATCSEVNRLRQVYEEYELRDFKRSKWSLANRGNQAIWEERFLNTRDLLQRTGLLPLGGRRILDVGCGTGEHLTEFIGLGAQPENLFGVDLMPERIRAAQRRNRQVRFQVANAEALPSADKSFDLVTVLTVFTSILNPQMASNVSREITRVLVSGGGVLWYDFRMNNPFNRHVRGIPHSRIRDLFPEFEMSLRTITLLPPVARRLGRLTGVLYAPLSSIPFLRSHYLGLLKKP